MIDQAQTTFASPVDLTEMKKMVGGKMEVILVLVEHVLAEYPEKLRQLRHALKTGDASQVRVIAHTLKSSLATFGAQEARALASSLEVSGAGGDLAEAEKILSRLELELERIIAFFVDPCWPNKV
jgi:HPt (histidine-containing phosphotransfer) domain-containing protein